MYFLFDFLHAHMNLISSTSKLSNLQTFQTIIQNVIFEGSLKTIPMKTIRKFALIFLALVSCSPLFAQQRSKNATIVDITVNDLAAAEKKVSAFIAENNLQPGKYYKSKYYIEIQLFLDQEQYDKVVSQYKTWGYISNENTTQTTYEYDMQKLREDLVQLRNEKETYLSLSRYADSTAKGSYATYIEKTIGIDKAILQDEMKLKEFENASKVNYIQIKVTEESNSTMEYSSTWVNMPGLEYSHLWVEQPKSGVTPSVMHGVSLKYMFNTGKSYGMLGLYKNYEAKTKYNEVYTFAFGQDFYSRRMGRGQRKFFNLYTSFNAGVYVLTGENQRSASWFVNPYLGLEIFKNKYFLIDNKVGYFMPYRDNRNLRGLLYNFSFNFVF